jgi:hypothetical protein
MIDTSEAGDALTLIAKFIEQQASECLAETGGDRGVQALASELCTTPDIFCRALEIGTVVSALMDRLDWPGETKLACREVLAGYAQRDLALMAKVRARRGELH